MNPKVTIIILNWNCWEDTIECMDSLYKISYPNYDVVLIDNDSKNESIDKIRQHAKSKYLNSAPNEPIEFFEYTRTAIKTNTIFKDIKNPSIKKIILIKNENNYGFVEGNNIGIKYALSFLNPEYILLLNNDTVVEVDFLTKLVETGESDADIGVIGPSIFHYNNMDKINQAGGRVNYWMGLAENRTPKQEDLKKDHPLDDVDYIEGSCFLIKRHIIDEAGLIDSNFLAYWEDVDWCIRIKNLGYRIICCNKSRIFHKISSSSKKISGYREYYSTRNRFLFMKKHATRPQKTCFLIFFVLFNFSYKSLKLILYHRNLNVFNCYCKGARDGLIEFLHKSNSTSTAGLR